MNPTPIHHERMSRFCRAGLYLVTSQALSRGRPTLDIVKAALAGGVQLIQLREKDMLLPDFIQLAKQVRQLTLKAGALLIINDRLDVAMGVDADGIHLGQTDFPVTLARKLAPDMIIGVSTHNVEEVQAAQTADASYINIGPIFPTQTKAWSGMFLGWEGLRNMAQAAKLPFSVMGGIKRKHIPALLQAGARTLAVITAITKADNPEADTRDLLNLIRGIKTQ